MDIRFKIQDVNYRIKSNALDLHLEKANTVQDGENKGKETFVHVGHHKNVFECLKNIPDEYILNSECKTMIEVGKLYVEVLCDIDELRRELQLNGKV